MGIALPSPSALTVGALGLGNLLLATPQVTGYQPQPFGAPIPPPQQPAPLTAAPPSFLFDYEGENTSLLESDITDHYTEDNSAIQDQISLKPQIVTTQGFVSELNDIVPPQLQALQAIANKLTILSPYTPALSASALNAFNVAVQTYETANSLLNTAVSAWQSITGGAGAETQTKQQQAFTKFKGYYLNRTLFTIQTPWEILPNMAIKTLRAVQDADTNVISTFEITFKQMRFVNTQVTGGTAVYTGRLAQLASSLVNLGSSTPGASLGLNTQLGTSYPGVQ